LGFTAGDSKIPFLPLEIWHSYDGLMAIFFLFIGIRKIKREIISGELSDIKKATMPVIGKPFGGMIIPGYFIY